MRKLHNIKKLILTASVLCAATACSGGIRDVMGLRNGPPDEFRVVSNAPLVIPPEFNLRPPVPGAKRPQEVDQQQQAKDILFETPGKNNPSGESKAESVFLKKADVQDSDSQIKDLLEQDEQAAEAAKKKKGFFEKVASYTGSGSNDPVVNASKEKDRIAENKKEGKPANEGEVAVTTEGKGGLLNHVFGF